MPLRKSLLIRTAPLTSYTGPPTKNFNFRTPPWSCMTIITDNGWQFIDKELAKFYTGRDIKHITSYVEHPQTNGQAEVTNKVILMELRKRLDSAKDRWPEELVEVLWAYKCTPQSATNESPFSLVYGANAMIPVEIGEPSLHQELYDPTHNHQNGYSP